MSFRPHEGYMVFVTPDIFSALKDARRKAMGSVIHDAELKEEQGLDHFIAFGVGEIIIASSEKLSGQVFEREALEVLQR